MQTRNKVLDDIAQLAHERHRRRAGCEDRGGDCHEGHVDRWMADRNLVTREEFDAVRAMAQKAREENEALKARIDALEATRPQGVKLHRCSAR